MYAKSGAVRYVLCMKSEDLCPICRGRRKPYPKNKLFPFCSSRCKLADLGHWLDGRYALAGEPAGAEEEQDKPN